jgi:hypothetical protein
VNFDFYKTAIDIDSGSDQDEASPDEAAPAKGVPIVPPAPPNVKELLRRAKMQPAFDLGGAGSAAGKPAASGKEAGVSTREHDHCFGSP